MILNTHTQGFNKSHDFVVGQHLIQTGALNIQDLTTKRQNSLSLTVTAALGRATGRVTLNDVKFGTLLDLC